MKTKHSLKGAYSWLYIEILGFFFLHIVTVPSLTDIPIFRSLFFHGHSYRLIFYFIWPSLHKQPCRSTNSGVQIIIILFRIVQKKFTTNLQKPHLPVIRSVAHTRKMFSLYITAISPLLWEPDSVAIWHQVSMWQIFFRIPLIYKNLKAFIWSGRNRIMLHL